MKHWIHCSVFSFLLLSLLLLLLFYFFEAKRPCFYMDWIYSFLKLIIIDYFIIILCFQCAYCEKTKECLTFDLVKGTLHKACEGQDWKYKQCLGESFHLILSVISSKSLPRSQNVKPGSHMLPNYPWHDRRYCLGFCYAGKPGKLTWVQLHRHVDGKGLRWLLLLVAYVLICWNSIPGSTAIMSQVVRRHLRTRLYCTLVNTLILWVMNTPF